VHLYRDRSQERDLRAANEERARFFALHLHRAENFVQEIFSDGSLNAKGMEHLHSIEEKYTKRGVVCQRNGGKAKGRKESITAMDAKEREEIEPRRRQDAMGGMTRVD
jgi:hypothetical protein